MFSLPPLPYDYSALEPSIDKETMTLHHDKHHAAYVDNLNKLLDPFPDLLNSNPITLLTSLNNVPDDIRQKVRNNIGGHVNHTLFWEFMTPTKDLPVPKFIIDKFGSPELFQEQFSSVALNRFGSGWAWLIQDKTELKIVDTINQDNPLMENPATKILLGLDVWEHAYYLKYQNRRAEYIKNWWSVVNWTKVEANYSQA